MVVKDLDWLIIFTFFILFICVGLFFRKKSAENAKEYFLSGKNTNWWLLGFSMVATTFAADTPNLVTDIVRNNGISGNWVWWAFLLTGMLTVFVYAKLWQRSSALTDLEFYEMRYSGKSASFLRAFRSIYLGFIFNVMVMANVCLAMIKICSILIGWTAIETLIITGVITVVYSMYGGLRGILYTDFLQFLLAMISSVIATITIINLPEIGGLTNLMADSRIQEKLDFIPQTEDMFWSIFILPLAFQWWNIWYPGAEPGGGGYIAQRILSARNETDALKSTLFFNLAHYALRPWPWILVALASLIIYPDLDSIQRAFPNVDSGLIKDDLAYPAMMTQLPSGLLGLMLAGLFAAYMSTISTHLNWGASYLVNDFYIRFVHPQATDNQQVRMGRYINLLLISSASIIALFLSNALQGFQIILQIGAGTGLLFILRWFWWKISALSEITAMFVSFITAIYFQLIYPVLFKETLNSDWQFIYGVLITTIAWLTVTWLKPETDTERLLNFYLKIKPQGFGWNAIKKIVIEKQINRQELEQDIISIPTKILYVFIGSIMVYAFLFGIGYILTGQSFLGLVMTGIALCLLWLITKKVRHL